MIKNVFLLATVLLNPKFKPSTLVVYIDMENKIYESLLSGGNYECDMGNWISSDSKKYLSYYLKIYRMSDEKIKEMNFIFPNFQLDEFIRETYQILQEFDKLTPHGRINLKLFVEHVFKYGYLFKNSTENITEANPTITEIPILALYWAMSNLLSFINIYKFDNIHPLSQALSRIIEKNCSSTDCEVFVNTIHNNPELINFIKNFF